MYYFGRSSKTKLETCHPLLQEIANELIKVMDVMVVWGRRGKMAQNKAYEEGRSQLEYPRSKHNKFPSLAMDLAPWPLDWDDFNRFERMCGIIEGIALMKGIKIRLGRDFSSRDMPHIELILV